MKKRLAVAVTAVTASVALVLSGCAGCGGNDGKKNSASLSSNWYADTSYKDIQPTFDYNGREEVVYKVAFDNEHAGNTTYKVNYAEGTYTTKFYAVNFDRELVDGNYRSAYPENLKVYYYATELILPEITFTMGEESKTFGTSEKNATTIITECYFLNVQEQLRPLYSVQEIKGVFPAEYQTNNFSSTYKEYDNRYVTHYSFDGNSCKTVTVDKINGNEESVTTYDKLSETENTLFDVANLEVGIRAMQLSSQFTQVVSLYSPAGGMQDYTLTGASSNLTDEERKEVTDNLIKNNLFNQTYNDDGQQNLLNTMGVSVSLNAQNNMQGVSQTYWYATVENFTYNKPRATLVKMSVPANFSLGTFNYTLKDIISTIY